MSQDTITISREQAEAILGYLVSRPYQEVAAACAWLHFALNTPTSKD